MADKSIAENIANSAEGDIGAQLEKLRTDISQLARTVGVLVEQKGVVMGENVASGIDRLAATADELRVAAGVKAAAATAIARDTSTEAIDALADEVRRHPLRTLALSLGAGVVIGFLTRSK
ncbi:hypothetical protein [Methylobrevis pamukkalensis]|uniref:DUF883 domain-containing protein n=1 Tax=Methylobrevis pamukkalensis TaxID=1439726 RepID=A0A1E3H9C7_9HYPH|nr:hypothetical protein [Methylobrevis pamukkalensis]ODN72091.1 hypothetical protein A6302_00606 [Methylobrevis pamukkalensis]